MSSAPPPGLAPTGKQALLLQVLDELAEESADLDARVADLSADGWRTPTPAEGWTVHDSVAHLAATDVAAVQALSDPEAFTAGLARLLEPGADWTAEGVQQARATPSEQLLADWREGRARLSGLLREADADVRVPWFGPPMSPVSFVSARLMETWAHGQDVVDALDQQRPASPRLRSVAEIGVRAAPFSFALHGLAVPDAPVRVALTGPDGEAWTWGPTDAVDRVAGSALDFCLLVTQRRHRDDVDLAVEGEAAQAWLAVAQAFAGPPGTGREPLGSSSR